MTPFYRFIRAFFTPFVKLILRPRVSGLEKNRGDGGYILCCNHQSMLDMFILVITFPTQICFMAKKELFKNPIAAWFFSSLGAFPVDRGSGDTSAIKNALAVLEQNKVLGIFPEGTRNTNGRPGKAKAGAAMLAMNSGADVLPVAINYHGKPKMSSKITLSFGDIIKNADLAGEDTGRAALRTALNKIMSEITNLWETDN